jgi:16S rRNA A1518/A1519 N6-dimethyltransferase RsmA/KsgA/DIM1 with predicted DNA glycosylase/AP lyase activity
VSERRARTARRPGRARSQHFLRSQALAAELVRDAAVGPDDLVLDLGAGSGRLTRELARTAGRVVAVELDPRWAAHLRGRWGNVEVLLGDAATLALPRRPFRVVANLPFARTTAILRHLLDDPLVPLRRADVIVEWGVAVKRALPWPSTVNDVVWGAWYASAVTRRLPRRHFEPMPAVDAGVLVFERRACPLVQPERAAGYRRFVAEGFRRRADARELDAYEWARLFRRDARGASSARPARAGRRPRPRRGGS